MLNSTHSNRMPLTRSVFGLMLLSLAATALADSFTVQPARVSLSAMRPTATLMIHNPGHTETAVQFQVTDWSQVGGADRLKRSSRLLVHPSLVKLPPGGSQRVRVTLRLSAPRWREESYQVLMNEVPLAPGPGTAPGGTARVTRQASVPVFVLPPGNVEPELTWRLERSHDGALELRVSNHGNAHVQLRAARLRGASGQWVGRDDLSAWLLPDQGRAWLLGDDVADDSRWQLFAETDAGTIETELRVETGGRETTPASW